MSNVCLGIIGAGYIAQEHLKVINAMKGVYVEGITSRTISKAKKLAETFDINNVYKNIDSIINDCSLDGLLILVSANQIYDVTKKLIPVNIPIFIEKPAGLVPDETKTLTKLADKYGTKNLVGYNRRYYSIFHKGIELINQNGGLLGIAVEGHERFWKIGSGVILDEIRENWIYANSTHTIDLLRLFGGEIEQINALKKSLKEKNGDQFVASMKFVSGAIGTYTSHWFSPGGWTVTLYSDSIAVQFKPLEKGIWIDTDFQQHDIMPDEVDIKYKQGFYRQMEAFVNMVRTGTLEAPAMDLAEALKTMELAKEFAHA